MNQKKTHSASQSNLGYYFKKNFDSILRIIEVLLLGIFGVIISIQANSIARSQLELSKATSMPAIYVTEEQVFNSDGIVDTRKLNIYNDNGYMTNYRSERFSDIIITIYSDFQKYELRIPLEGFWTVGVHTGKMNGLIETRGNEKNLEKLQAILSNAEYQFALKNTDAYSFVWNTETYVKINYSDVQHNDQSFYYKLNPIAGTTMIEPSEYTALFNQHETNRKDYLIDIDLSTGDDLITIVNSLVE